MCFPSLFQLHADAVHVRVLSQSQSPYQQAHPFPESCGHWWACWPQGVVGGGKVQAGNRNLHWHQWWVGGASPAHQSPRPPLILSNRRRNRPRRPTTSLRHPNPPAAASSPQNGPRRPAVPFGHSTTHCGQPSLPGRCGQPGRATTLLSVAARCGPAPPIMVATATRRRRGRHNPPQPHRCGAARPVESRPPHTAVKPQKSVQRCSHEHDQR